MKRYGFYQGPPSKHRLPNLKTQSWYHTAQFKAVAKRHCAAVLVMNIHQYFDLQKDFETVHAFIGNGPVLFLKRKMKRRYQHDFKIETINSIKTIQKSIDANKPVALLLRRNVCEWHWVMVVGYEDNHLLEIVDGWHPQKTMRYKVNEVSKIVPFFSFSITKR